MTTEAHQSYNRDSMTLACDLARQFVNIAVGGVAFAVGLSVAVKIPACLLWAILIVFGLSVTSGLFLQMHAIALVWKGNYDERAT